MVDQPHPYVNAAKLDTFIGNPVALVGKVDKVEATSFTMNTSDDQTVHVVKVQGYSHLAAGQTVEVRGTVNQDKSL